MKQEKHKLIIIGAGPAGYTAALYAARAGLDPLLITGNQLGGQLAATTDVENYPGFSQSILGPDLMDAMHQQVLNAGARIVIDHINSVNFDQAPFQMFSSKNTYQSSSVIICTGAQAKWLGLDAERVFLGYGVSACATCDGPLFRNQDLAVIGGGNTAVEEALFLTRYAKSVTLIHRRDALRAEKILQKRLHEHPKIQIIWNHELIDIHGAEQPKSVQSITIQDVHCKTTKKLNVSGVFIAIGHRPGTDLFKGILHLDDAGYIQGQGTMTNIPGVFAAGDVRDHIYRQAITAAGQGCMAALDVQKYLENMESVE